MLPELASYLADHGISGVVLGTCPSDPAGVLALYEERGEPPECAFDGVLWERPRVLVLARDASYELAEARINAAYVLLRRVANVLIEECFYHTISAIVPPTEQGEDDRGRPVFAFVITIRKALSPCSWI